MTAPFCSEISCMGTVFMSYCLLDWLLKFMYLLLLLFAEQNCKFVGALLMLVVHKAVIGDTLSSSCIQIQLRIFESTTCAV